ncbi:MAG: polyribonucleotide nucleotidyltransferase [Parcubacteria group bacterium Gr01-1014_3]|nr:MAG: polyribonucleotide nucleotidyltransferase [Parcubacteria group bacterium Gr01-1014_3]
MNLNRKKFSIDFQGRPLELEVSKIAEQANASVIGRYGDTVVLVTVVMGKVDKNIDYFPLTVDYEERFYAVGKILGSRFVRREGRPAEEAVLSGRMIDRTIRPLFDHRLRRDVQVVVTILSVDEENDPDYITLLTVSAALAISNIPWAGPVAGVRMLNQTVNPIIPQIKSDWPKQGSLQAFVAGTIDRINMLEVEAVEADEKDVAAAFETAHKEIVKLIEFQNKMVKEIGVKKADVMLSALNSDLKSKMEEFLKGKLEPAMYEKEKVTREERLAEVKESLKAYLTEQGIDEAGMMAAENLLEVILDELVHKNILESDKRPDGRKLDEVRDLHAEVAFLKRAHGSALFVRGNTQALGVTTIAPPGSEQLIETMEFSGKKRFMLHYNFPPYSTGEVGRVGNPGRREIGHGALAEKAVRNMLPAQEQFPYIVRVVSEILSSNGSSSMATVCATSLSLMDAGVPIKAPIAGIAMGLMSNDKGDYKILTDIQGPEDHYGDMDCKVAGTKNGVTAMQMDVKIQGLTVKILAETLAQSKKARLQILEVMSKAIAAPRPETSIYAPVVLSIDIDPDKIGEVIGPGGKMINGIIERTGALTIDIEQSGRIYIAGPNREKAQAAFREVEGIVKEYKLGEIVEGTIVRILDFGAIVEFAPGRDGMVHVSELKDGFVKKVEDVVKMGDVVRAKIVRVEDGRIGLSLKGVPQK